MHPSGGVDREYAVRVRGNIDEDMIARLKKACCLKTAWRALPIFNFSMATAKTSGITSC